MPLTILTTLLTYPGWPQDDSGDTTGVLIGLLLNCCWLIVAVLMIVALWKVFSKANEPGWAAIIPVYNTYIILKIVGRPWWWLLLLFIPLVNIVVGFVVLFDLAKSFGRGAGFALGLIFLSPIFFMLLGFGSDTYQGPVAG